MAGSTTKYPRDVGFPLPKSRNLPFLVVCFHLLYLLLPAAVAVSPFLPIYHLFIGAFTSFDKKLLSCCVLYYSTWILTAHLTKRGGSNRFLNSNPILTYVLSMIPISIRLTTEITPDLSPSGSYIFPCHPHGALAFNRAAVGFCMSELYDAAFPQLPNLKVLVASAAFYVPIVRELWLASYCIEASKKVAVAAIKRGGRGTAVLVYPGGETEQLLTVRGRERVYLSGRKGFIKLALERGCEVCPVYAFGESDLYEHSQLFIGLRRTIQKKFGAAVPLIYGQIGLLPYFPPNGVKLVWGAPIGLFKGRKWAEGEEVTQAMIDDGHALYVAKLKELFDSEKASMGYGDRELEIL